MRTSHHSDGVVDRAVVALCENGLDGYDRKDVDKTLKDRATLNRCKQETLCLAFWSYHQAYGEKNWHIMQQLQQLARVSNTYRDFLRQTERSARGIDDPMRVLLQEPGKQ